MPISVVVVGDILVAVGLGMATIVVNQNSYAAATITVEAEQPVVSTGLYGLVRHPMYAGALIMIVGMPLALDSYWGLVTLVPAVAVLALRIDDEEKMLRRGTCRVRRVHPEGALPVGARASGDDGPPTTRRGTPRPPRTAARCSTIIVAFGSVSAM